MNQGVKRKANRDVKLTLNPGVRLNKDVKLMPNPGVDRSWRPTIKLMTKVCTN